MSKSKFLYLLWFKSGDRFKVGFTVGAKRLRKFDRLYSVDFTKSYLVFAKSNRIIRSLESQILAEYEDDIIEVNKEDGYTEIRSSSIFESALEDLSEKAKKKEGLKMRIEKLTNEF